MTAVPDSPAPSTSAPLTGRRHLLRAAAWTTPAVIIAASAPAFADSTTPAGSLEFNRGSDDTGEIVVSNDGEALTEFRLEFSPAPDEATVGALMAYSGFTQFRRVSDDPYVLAGEIEPGKRTTAWAWWRDRASSADPAASTTVRLYAGGELLDEVTLTLGS